MTNDEPEQQEAEDEDDDDDDDDDEGDLSKYNLDDEVLIKEKKNYFSHFPSGNLRKLVFNV